MRERATLGQGKQVLDLLQQSGISKHRLQDLLSTGILSDIFEADATRLDRPEFRRQVSRTRYTIAYGNIPLPPATKTIESERALFLSLGGSNTFSEAYWESLQRANIQNLPFAVDLITPDKDFDPVWFRDALVERGRIHGDVWELLRLAQIKSLQGYGRYFLGLRFSVCKESAEDLFPYLDAETRELSYCNETTPREVWDTGLIVVLS